MFLEIRCSWKEGKVSKKVKVKAWMFMSLLKMKSFTGNSQKIIIYLPIYLYIFKNRFASNEYFSLVTLKKPLLNTQKKYYTSVIYQVFPSFLANKWPSCCWYCMKGSIKYCCCCWAAACWWLKCCIIVANLPAVVLSSAVVPGFHRFVGLFFRF